MSSLNTDDRALVLRIAKRLNSPDAAIHRAGGRAAALQVIEHRLEMIRALRGHLAEQGEDEQDAWRRGYRDALLDMLLIAESTLEPQELAASAQRELAQNEALQDALDRIAQAPITPSELADQLQKSRATAGRYLQQLKALTLVAALPTADGRERPHRATPLGRRLARVDDTPAPGLPPRDLDAPLGNPIETVKQDPLTGCYVLQEFKKRLAKQVSLHADARKVLSVMRVDVDGYSELAESRGFATLNERIMDFAKILIHEVREYDETGSPIVGRYEPDKFLLCLPSIATTDAWHFAQALMPKLPISASIGIAGADAASYIDADTLLVGSDEALQAAKASGPGSLRTWAPMHAL